MLGLKFKINSEDKLIRFSARSDVDINYQLKIKNILSPDLGWAYFFKKAHNERLSPLMYKSLSKIEGAQKIIPGNIWQNLKESYYCSLSDNISGLSQLEKIVRNIQSEGADIIIFKGLMLAELIYSDLGLRPCGDLDILIKREDIFKVDKVLRNLGYSTTFDSKNFEEIRFNNYRNSFFYFSKKETDRPLHIHWHLINTVPYNKKVCSDYNIQKIWADAEPIKLGSVSLKTFSVYHQIIYLSMHALSHSFYPLILLCDINEILRLHKKIINWDTLVEEAFQLGLSKHLFYSLYLVSRILFQEVPQEAMDKLKPKKISLFEKKFISSVLKGKHVFGADWLMFLGMNEILRDRIFFLGQVLLLPKVDLALVRGKNVSEINIFDYLKRANSGINHAFRSLVNLLVQ